MNCKDFRIGDLFDIHPTKTYKLTNQQLFDSGQTPVISNTSANNGVGGYTSLAPTEHGGIITFSDTTTSDAIFYQPDDFVGYSHVQGMYPKFDGWTEESLLYFASLFKKCAAGRFDYATKFTRKIAADMIILLPVKEIEEIDFEYMENYIAELEAERVAELEAERVAELDSYLEVTGLNNYELTTEELVALKRMREMMISRNAGGGINYLK